MTTTAQALTSASACAGVPPACWRSRTEAHYPRPKTRSIQLHRVLTSHPFRTPTSKLLIIVGPSGTVKVARVREIVRGKTMRKISPILMALVAIVALVSTSPVASAQTKKRTTTRVVPLVPVGTDLKIRINDTLSSKESRVGDRFTATVIDPSRFDEATVRGHISSIQKSGKVKGRTSMNLAFDSVELRDGRRGVLHGYVTRVYGDDAGKADNEGGIQSGSRTNQTVKRTGIGAGVGAIIGGIAGGGKGAAIGLIVGGAGGAGSLAVKGSKELKIESGTEMLVHVTR